MVYPVIHLNGTSAKELLRQACDVGRALRIAINACADAAPNARDYYPQPGSFEKAQEQHKAIAKTLCDAIEHYQMLAEHISEQ